ncbi:MAG: murein biosynthesis integral membrane protein MurJ [Alphaproteobacteria bacterium]|nr:murein biosynthesis integral membrane protein MurJ [Alphaproteobacteria bacterium]MDX5368833.1 murein biosynthesis integral membrane protein MurJ [Alphaproteobacteria bacterium]MDX5463561.1 murein biosynthesis integral membrane protein MurJ [Alphaproteobacteria bacterium]
MALLRSAAAVSGMTLVSRVLGFVRDIMVAAALGAGPVADAFVTAFQFPNLFRRLFAEGAFNAAFVPMFSRRLGAGDADHARSFAEEALSLLLAWLVGLTALALAAMPWVVYVLAPGFSAEIATRVVGWLTGAGLPAGFDTVAGTPAAEDGKFALTVAYARVLFPYLAFVSLVALYSGILNATGRFAVAAAAPILLNVFAIAALTFAAWSEVAAGDALVWGVLVSGLAQLLLVVRAAGKAGYALRLRAPRLTPDARRFLKLMVPGVIAGGITQINIVVGGAIASFQDGARAFLYYADRVYQFPLGLIGVAIGIVLLPDIARRLGQGDETGAVRIQNRACEFAMLLTLPAACALAALSLPVVRTLFERGNFDAADAVATAAALAVYAVGLPAFVLIKVFQPAYFAREDTRTPMRYAGWSVLVNIAVSLALFPVLGHVGIAAATVAASALNAGLLLLTLTRRGGFSPDERLKRRLPRLLLASLLMAGAVGLAALWPGDWGGLGGAGRAGALALLVVAGVGLYAGLVLLLRAADVGELKASLKRRPRPPASPSA